MKYGVSYYPEHRDEAEMDKEISLMKEAGINVVRLSEFAWCRMEPEEGQFCFSWLDQAVDKLGEAGIETIICTPTACPPAWMVEKHPEILYVDNRGVTRPFGGRRHYCYNNPVYREYSRRIAEEIGKHYGNNPHVIGFQIDNELAQEGTGRCHCDCCKEKFQLWLEKKYGTVDNLNQKMGTIFWSQEYNHFGQINMPINTIEVDAQEEIHVFYENPSLRLDFERFCSDSNIEYQEVQRTALRKHSDKVITTNATGLATNSIDYYQAFNDLDVYAYDFYPSLRDREVSSFSYAFARGVKNRDFWVMEFVSGGGHRLRGSGRLQPYPSALTQAVIHAFCSGAELMAHFQFRTFPFGAEQLNYAILDADGIPRRMYREMTAAARDLRKLEAFLGGSAICNKVAICFDYDAHWSLKIKPINQDTFDYLAYCNELYDILTGSGIGTDVISRSHSLDEYKLVIVPTPFVMSAEYKNRLKEYVSKGGTVISTFLAGAKNEYNTGLCESLPCGMTDLFGIRVGELEPVFADTVSQINLTLGNNTRTAANQYWTEELEPNGAEFIGIYENTFRKGKGVISRNQYGKGTAIYVGTGLDKESMAALLDWAAEQSGVQKVQLGFPEGVEVIERSFGGESAYCIFNFLKEEAEITLDKSYHNLVNGEAVKEHVKIGPKSYAILCR